MQCPAYWLPWVAGQGLYTQQCHFHNNSAGWGDIQPLSHQDILLEGPKVSGHPKKERDVLPPGLLMPLHAEVGICPPTSGKPPACLQELHLSDMDGLCTSLSEGSAFGDTVVSQPHLSRETLPQWSEVPGGLDTGPSNDFQQIWLEGQCFLGGHTPTFPGRESL